MFEQIETRSSGSRISRPVAVWGAVFFAFLFGCMSGILARQLVLAQKPHDWPLTAVQLLVPLFWMIWLGILAARNNS